MISTKRIIDQMLLEAGVVVNGDRPWDIQVHDERFYSRLLADKNLALGEAYMNGWWTCERLDEFFHLVMKKNLEEKVKGGLGYLLRLLPARLFNLQSKRRAVMVAERHYNIGNDLFLSFLDPFNQYSCGYFDGTDDLQEAQLRKLDLICRKLNLGQGDHVLDIGSGWGGFARYAAERYGCRVTAVNVSTEQNRFTESLCRGLPVRVEPCDYRSISGRFDKIVSIGMFEHVGGKNYREFMQVAHRCLKDGGVFLLHTIGANESRTECDPWITKYIFPNGMLPGMAQICKAIEGLFVVEDWHSLGPHYDRTLMCWYRNFQEAWPRLKERYDEVFKRMWDYYLLSCAGAFRARVNQLWQIVMTKYGTEQPVCRF